MRRGEPRAQVSHVSTGRAAHAFRRGRRRAARRDRRCGAAQQEASPHAPLQLRAATRAAAPGARARRTRAPTVVTRPRVSQGPPRPARRGLPADAARCGPGAAHVHRCVRPHREARSPPPPRAARRATRSARRRPRARHGRRRPFVRAHAGPGRGRQVRVRAAAGRAPPRRPALAGSTSSTGLHDDDAGPSCRRGEGRGPLSRSTREQPDRADAPSRPSQHPQLRARAVEGGVPVAPCAPPPDFGAGNERQPLGPRTVARSASVSACAPAAWSTRQERQVGSALMASARTTRPRTPPPAPRSPGAREAVSRALRGSNGARGASRELATVGGERASGEPAPWRSPLRRSVLPRAAPWRRSRPDDRTANPPRAHEVQVPKVAVAINDIGAPHPTSPRQPTVATRAPSARRQDPRRSDGASIEMPREKDPRASRGRRRGRPPASHRRASSARRTRVGAKSALTAPEGPSTRMTSHTTR